MSISTHNKLCAWRHNMSPPPASLTIISCKYENRQRLIITEFAKKKQSRTTRQNKHCAILPSLCRRLSKQSKKAKHSRIWAQAMPFLSIKQVDLRLSNLESGFRVTCDVDYTSVPILVSQGLSVLKLGPMYATDRQTDRRQTDVVRQRHRLMHPPYGGGGITNSCLNCTLLSASVFISVGSVRCIGHVKKQFVQFRLFTAFSLWVIHKARPLGGGVGMAKCGQNQSRGGGRFLLYFCGRPLWITPFGLFAFGLFDGSAKPKLLIAVKRFRRFEKRKSANCTLQVISETNLSSQSLALVLTT